MFNLWDILFAVKLSGSKSISSKIFSILLGDVLKFKSLIITKFFTNNYDKTGIVNSGPLSSSDQVTVAVFNLL